MLEKVSQIVQDLVPNANKGSYLLAISGGIDSMVLLMIFKNLGYTFSVGHINHQLRGDASDQDETLILKQCDALGIKCYTQRIVISEEQNTQLAARNARYQILHEWRKSHNIDYLVTAHHQDDREESFFINLARGAGINGLSSIKSLNGSVIRPLLHCTKAEILAYAEHNKVPYRNDQSNSSLKYLRNKIRHEVIPMLHEVDPRFKSGINNSISHLNHQNKLLAELVNRTITYEVVNADIRQYAKEQLQDFENSTTLLHYLFAPYGFSFTQVQNLRESLSSLGQVFYANDHQIKVERSYIELSKTTTQSKSRARLIIDDFGHYETSMFSFEISQISEISIDRHDRYLECIDAKALIFPLSIRYWSAGDSFQPIGMKGLTKSLKKYFTDIKLSERDRKNTAILVNGDDKIIWVSGYRLDHRFAADATSTEFVLLRLNPNIDS